MVQLDDIAIDDEYEAKDAFNFFWLQSDSVSPLTVFSFFWVQNPVTPYIGYLPH